MQRFDSTLARGVVAGIIGAAALALFFFIVDFARGTPLQTPAFLAGAVAGRGAVDTSMALIALYTLVHFILFIAVGIGVTWLLGKAGIRPHFLLGLVLGFLLFDLVFYAGVIVTGVNVVRALGWPEVLAGNLFAGLAMFAFLQATAPEGTPSWREAFRLPDMIREGVIAGMAGAVAVAIWFLVIDAIQGRLFFTPAALGSALMLRAQDPVAVDINATVIGAYTLVHFLGFITVGILIAALAHGARREPRILLGAALLFVTFQVFFIGMLAIAASWLLDEIAWWAVVVANIIAAVIMGGYLWRQHPELREEIRRSDLEEPSYGPGTR